MNFALGGAFHSRLQAHETSVGECRLGQFAKWGGFQRHDKREPLAYPGLDHTPNRSAFGLSETLGREPWGRGLPAER